MSLFGKLVRAAVNLGVGVPVALVKDVVTLGNATDPSGMANRTQSRPSSA